MCTVCRPSYHLPRCAYAISKVGSKHMQCYEEMIEITTNVAVDLISQVN